MESNRNIGRVIIGIVLILIGVAFIGRTLDIFPARMIHHIFSWQMILIVLGIIFISSRENKTTGLILLIIGLVFLVPDMFYIPYPVRRLFWPSLLIIIGLVIILRSNSVKIFSSEGTTSDYIDDISIFGGGDKTITSQNFRGGKITAIFGGSKIDLTRADLAPGKNIIDIFCLFGGTTLIVPDNWTVKSEVVSVLGGFSDKRHFRNDTTFDVGKEIIVRGFVMFGAGEIKS